MDKSFEINATKFVENSYKIFMGQFYCRRVFSNKWQIFFKREEKKKSKKKESRDRP